MKINNRPKSYNYLKRKKHKQFVAIDKYLMEQKDSMGNRFLPPKPYPRPVLRMKRGRECSNTELKYLDEEIKIIGIKIIDVASVKAARPIPF